ncbi:hypothetical protein ACLBWZ_09085 [Brucellaceae bacterium C25G]
MIIHFLISKLRKFFGFNDDPLPALRKRANELQVTIAKNKRDKKKYSHLERELYSINAIIMTIERGIPYRNGKFEWGK